MKELMTAASAAKYFRVAPIVAGLLMAGAAQASNSFDSAGDVAGATVDRYAPATFESGVSFDGRLVLQESTAVADGASNRSSSYSSSFYNTQGKALALDPGTLSMSIELYVPSDWTKQPVNDVARLAGFWGVATDASNAISSYPIIELANVSNVDTWRVWDSAGAGSWMNLGAATSGWNTLSIGLSTASDQFIYSVGSYSASVGALGSTSIGSTILQVHNTADGVANTVYWDNLNTSDVAPVPEPASWAMMIAGMGMLGFTMRRRAAKASVAFA